MLLKDWSQTRHEIRRLDPRTADMSEDTGTVAVCVRAKVRKCEGFSECAGETGKK